jgi:hypothetical protein
MISKHNHRRTKQRLYQMFTVGISDRKRRRLLAEVDNCEQCRIVCRSYHQYEAALSQVGEAGSTFARERMASGIFARLSILSPKTNQRRVGVKLAAVLAPFAALALFVLFLVSNSPSFRVSLPSDFGDYSAELAPRGGLTSASPDFGFRAFAISRNNRRVQENNEISKSGLLTFTYTRTNPAPGYLALFGVQESSRVIWYYPDFGEKESIRIVGDRVDEPLSDGFNVSVNHVNGPLLLVALFSEQPISIEKIEVLADKEKNKALPLDEWGPRIWQELEKNVTVYSILSTVEDDND